MIRVILGKAASVFGRPFVNPFALCYRTVVLSVLSVTLVYYCQTVGQIEMKLGVRVGLGPGHIVLDFLTHLPLPGKGAEPPFSAHVYCRQTAG